MKGWAVPHLAGGDEFHQYYKESGFENIIYEDISDDVEPRVFAIYRFSFIFVPIRWIMNKLKITSDEKLGNAIATYYQYKSFKSKHWRYEIFCGTKPK